MFVFYVRILATQLSHQFVLSSNIFLHSIIFSTDDKLQVLIKQSSLLVFEQLQNINEQSFFRT
jgi:hypothetical protein